MRAQIQHRDIKGSRWILQALVPFTELKGAVLFTYRANSYQTEDETKGKFQSSLDFYQRRVDSKRSDEIKDFIRSSILQERNQLQMATLFPTSMILALNAETEESGNTLKEIDKDTCELDVKTNVFIVDGQHRMMGMMKLYDEIDQLVIKTEEDEYVLEFLQKYKFNCTILINYDLWEQGQVFVNVNFKQKPVNKSLYYEIFGSEYREAQSDWQRNKIYLAHTMTKMLNEHNDSPFYHRIKMLGTGKGYVSQAFVVEALQRLFRKDALWYFDPDETDLKESDTDYFGTELLSFFVAVKRLFEDYWPSKDSVTGTIICKTTGFGAWVRMMGLMRQDEDIELRDALKKSAQKNEFCEVYVEHVIGLIEPLKEAAEILFGKDSEFKSSSGQGSEVKLYKKMLFYIQNPVGSKQTDTDYPFDPDILCEEIQEYVWTTPVDDLDPLGHHYEVEDISAFNIVSYQKGIDTIRVKVTFTISVNIYLDNEDDSGFFMQFPAECKAELEKEGDEYELNGAMVEISVDTDKYYQ